MRRPLSRTTDGTVVREIEQVLVVVPAHEEQERIGGLLASVHASASRLVRAFPGLPVRIVVAADGCTDATVERARVGGAEVVQLQRSGVGATRAAGIAHALASSIAATERIWIANTDADTLVPREWLLAHVEHARHHDALLGTVRPNSAELAPEAYRRWQRTRAREESVGSIHGANLGVRASAYLAAGGFGDDVLHEDVLLVARLRATSARIGASSRGEVVTSARRDNRVDGGYGRYLHTQFAQEAATASA